MEDKRNVLVSDNLKVVFRGSKVENDARQERKMLIVKFFFPFSLKVQDVFGLKLN